MNLFIIGGEWAAIHRSGIQISRLFLHFSVSRYFESKYWVGRKVCSGFSVSFYGKI